MAAFLPWKVWAFAFSLCCEEIGDPECFLLASDYHVILSRSMFGSQTRKDKLAAVD